MRVLVVGGGGREHALCRALCRSKRLETLWCAPGNPGIARIAQIADLATDDIEALLRFAKDEGIDLTVVGPEAPLAAGLADRFAEEGLRVFGPRAAAARLEASKAYAKEICRRYHIPTATSWTFDAFGEARRFLEAYEDYPVVVKADGLAAGKGVVIAGDRAAAIEAARRAMVERAFGEAGRRVVVEEFLRGEEASVIAIVDGRTIAVLEPARDHKAAFDGDRGPNTGGMGAISPTRRVGPETLERVEREILVPAVHALAREAGGFVGFLYAGLMLTRGGPKVLEFNVRMGDPEAQAVLPRLLSDLLEVLDLAVEGRLVEAGPLQWDPRHACCVVLASEGYPGEYETGFPIHGLEEAEAEPDVFVFHAGTALSEGRVVTAGGRVLSVTALGTDLSEARRRAYDAVGKIRFQGARYRTDIGKAEEAL